MLSQVVHAGGLVAIILITAVLVSLTLGGWVCRWLRAHRVVDPPSRRSSHEVPTVRGGGIAILTAVVVGLTAILVLSPQETRPLFWLLPIVLVLGGVSFVDDLKNLPQLTRFVCHAAAALAVLAALDWPQVELSLGTGWKWVASEGWALVLMFLWIVGYTNAFNFMDGINGLAGAQASVGGIGGAIIAATTSGNWESPAILTSMAIGGAALGFLPYNFPRAMMFMGDVGSITLGFLLAVVSLWIADTHGWWLLIPLVLLRTNFILDTAITLVRRVLRGERWYEAHREHFYQRLVRAGKSHAFVTGWEMAIQLIVLGMMVAYVLVQSNQARIFLIAAVIAVWLSFFSFCEQSFIAKSERDNP